MATLWVNKLPKTIPDKKVLNVPYSSQLDNVHSPFGTCNLTSVAMVLRYFGVKGNGQGQLEDQLYLKYGDRRWYSSTMDEAFAAYGIEDDYAETRRIEDVIWALANGCPVIIHGYFTSSGHIVVIKGYDHIRKVFIVNDPYGEYFGTGYDTYRSGEDLEYSYGLIQRLCEDQNGMWVHIVRGKKKQ